MIGGGDKEEEEEEDNDDADEAKCRKHAATNRDCSSCNQYNIN